MGGHIDPKFDDAEHRIKEVMAKNRSDFGSIIIHKLFVQHLNLNIMSQSNYIIVNDPTK